MLSSGVAVSFCTGTGFLPFIFVTGLSGYKPIRTPYLNYEF